MQYKFEDFIIHENKLIGKGTFGNVFGCSVKNQPSLNVVVKICAIQIDQRELDILNQLAQSVHCNQNIVQVYFICKHDFKIYIFMEGCQNDLKTLLLEKKSFSEQDALEIIKQIANGYYALYKENIIHRDIKPANILIKNNIYKLTDFGEGKIMKNYQDQLTQTKRGTPAYQSPQIQSCFEQKAQATSKMDIFSLGLIFYELIAGKLPYDEPINKINISKFYIEISKEDFKAESKCSKISSQSAKLINWMLKYNENERISWEQFFSHELIRIDQQQRQKSQNSQKSTQESSQSQVPKQESPMKSSINNKQSQQQQKPEIIKLKPQEPKFQTNLQNQKCYNQDQNQFQPQNQNNKPQRFKTNIVVVKSNQLIEYVKKLKIKAAELSFIPLFQQIPFIQGFFQVKEYILKNQLEFKKYLPYHPNNEYSLNHLYVVAGFYKLIRNESFEGEFINENSIVEYLKSLKLNQ